MLFPSSVSRDVDFHCAKLTRITRTLCCPSLRRGVNGLAVFESLSVSAKSRPRWHSERKQTKVNVRTPFNNTNATDKTSCDSHTSWAAGNREHHKRNVNVNIVG